MLEGVIMMWFLFFVIVIWFLFLFLVLASGCAAKTEVTNKQLRLEGSPFSSTVREFEYGGCQYISFGECEVVIHKGNCKYCQQRNK